MSGFTFFGGVPLSVLYDNLKIAVAKICGDGKRERAMGTRRPIEIPLALNQRWSLDFVSDQLTDGRRFRILRGPANLSKMASTRASTAVFVTNY